jgi:hypothetical protein
MKWKQCSVWALLYTRYAQAILFSSRHGLLSSAACTYSGLFRNWELTNHFFSLHSQSVKHLNESFQAFHHL